MKTPVEEPELPLLPVVAVELPLDDERDEPRLDELEALPLDDELAPDELLELLPIGLTPVLPDDEAVLPVEPPNVEEDETVDRAVRG